MVGERMNGGKKISEFQKIMPTFTTILFLNSVMTFYSRTTFLCKGVRIKGNPQCMTSPNGSSADL